MAATQPYLLTVRAFSTFVVLDLAFRFLGFDKILRFLLRRPQRPVPWLPAKGQEQARRTFQAVQNATMLYYRNRKDCLPKALATLHLLRRQGIPADLCFAVKKFPFAAHAWVEAYGAPLDDEPTRLQCYTIIHRIAG